jgi:hypothetical protein
MTTNCSLMRAHPGDWEPAKEQLKRQAESLPLLDPNRRPPPAPSPCGRGPMAFSKKCWAAASDLKSAMIHALR